MDRHKNTRPRPEKSRSASRVREAQAGVGHPALLPGLGVERTDNHFGINWAVFAVAAVFVVGVISWGAAAPQSFASASNAGLQWVSRSFGWLFGLLTAAVFAFMMWLGFGPYRSVRLGRDDEKPEFSTGSWLAMMFSAGIGIGLLFYGPYEPMTYFLDLPPAYESIDPGSNLAMHAALVQTAFHWGPMAWAYYALVGGAAAYSSFRKGRPALISSLLDPILGNRTKGWIGAVVDAFAIIVTLFGVAVSLGIGTLQIGRGVEIVAGVGPLGNDALIAVISALSIAFIVSAVSGVKRGIRALSNINMAMAAILGIFVFIVGPTAFLLNLFQGTLMTFVGDSFRLLAQSAATSGDAQAFMDTWTTFYWAWWVSWTPFVGLFVARISRGRTLREFVITVIVTPSAVCLVWFTILGGTSMWTERASGSLSAAESPQDMLFALLHELPAGTFTSIIAMISIVIFFVTGADSGAIVMASLSERGNPTPRPWITVAWAVALAISAAVLMLGGGSVALNGLQSLVIVTALPFTLVVVLVMVAWARDLARDPLVLRRRYAREAIAQGVRIGIENHGDDFVVGVVPTRTEAPGAGAWLDSDDPELTAWYRPRNAGPEAGESAEPSTGPRRPSP